MVLSQRLPLGVPNGSIREQVLYLSQPLPQVPLRRHNQGTLRNAASMLLDKHRPTMEAPTLLLRLLMVPLVHSLQI
jgi:hypothetical protein